MAFRPDVVHPTPPRPEPQPVPAPQPAPEPKPTPAVSVPAETPSPAEHKPQKSEQSPFLRLLGALQNHRQNGLDGEDLLLIGIIALLLGKEGNEDVLLILAMLLLL